MNPTKSTTDEGKLFTAEHLFKRVTWRNVLSIGASMEQFTTWTVTGIGALIGLIVGHLDSVSKIVSSNGLRWALIMLALSLAAGVVSKMIGMTVSRGVETTSNLEAFLASPDGQQLMSLMTINPRDLARDISEPFIWPLSWFIRRGATQGAVDYLAADKKFIRLFCFQLVANGLHVLLAGAAVVTIAWAI